ncbi:MAG: hypothetical protein VB111_05535 [Clostridiaceae bacterium]|nr:hypothetical protein [Clostridiaceae bacterium]
MNPVYRTREHRQETALTLLSAAAAEREPIEARWNLVTDYYEGHHHTQDEIAESCRDAGIPWIAAASPDIYMHVESQITAVFPDFTFRGRDAALDDARAHEREYLVRYVTDHQNLPDLVPIHERRCILCGTAVWKVFWDGADVRVASVDPRAVYPDPTAARLEDCEYVSYVYRLPRRAIDRLYGDDLALLGLDAETMSSVCDVMPFADHAVFDDREDGTLPVVEHWYRDDGGRVACSILVSGREARHIPDYWRATACGQLPFVFQYRVARDELWGRSDIEPALPLIDAVDRELAAAQLQSAFTGADIILAEHDAFSQNPEQRPGAIWELKPGAIGKIRRLGGLGDAGNRLEMVDALRGMIQDAVGNYDVSFGKEPARMLSAAGLAQLLERADMRKASKKTERLRAYSRLFRLIDWTILEFYDDDRVIRLGTDADGEAPRTVCFSRDSFRDVRGYFPVVDCTVTAADALETSRAFTLSALETLLAHSVTRENYPLILAALRALDLEDAEALREHFERVFAAEKQPAAAPNPPEEAQEINEEGEVKV